MACKQRGIPRSERALEHVDRRATAHGSAHGIARAVAVACLALQGAAWAAADLQLAAARTPASLSRLSIEELAEIEVSSVSKRPERLADAAASVFVITADDIRRSGASTLPEILRLAPNVQVARANANSHAISARGFNNTSANKLLVMIDGRSVYTPLHSGVFWDVQDVMVRDIERIEVISGPGGTLWGANAVNGVINVITRSADRTVGNLVSAVVASDERALGVRHGRQIGPDAAVRLYAQGQRFDHSERADGSPVRDAWDRRQVGFRADGGRPDAGWRLQGDAYEGDAQGGNNPDRRASGANLLGSVNRDLGERSSLRAQVYFDTYSRRQPGLFNQKLDTVDIDVQHRFAFGSNHELLWGGGLREHRDHAEGSALLAFVPVDSRLTLANLFAQDTVSIGERLKLTVGLKLEHNNYTGLEVQPNLRLAWKPGPQSLLWSAVSRAVRTPSRLDRDFFVFINLPPPYGGRLLGGNSFESERLTAYELGYRGQPWPSLSYSVTGFIHDYDRLRSIEPTGSGDYVLGNGVRGRSHGLEAWGSYEVSKAWRIDAGLSLLRQRLRFAEGSADPGSPNAGGNDPRHQFMLRSSWTLPRDVSLDLNLRAIGALPSPEVPSYVSVDARVGWQVTPGFEVSLVAFNLLGERHAEFGASPSRSEFDRTLSLRLVWDL
jgi:iron complex outermembrane receptor protein